MTTNEAYAQSQVRLEAPTKGVTLWRNNVGVLLDKNGRPVRFGLANETHALNEMLKSSDLIGWRSVVVTPDMVGRRLAVWTDRECKRPGWIFNPNDPHERGQKAWQDMVNAAGGDSAFATGPGTL